MKSDRPGSKEARMRNSMMKAAVLSFAALAFGAAAEPTSSLAANSHGGAPSGFGGYGGGAIITGGGVSHGGVSGGFHGPIGVGPAPGALPSFGGFHGPSGPAPSGGFPIRPPIAPGFGGATSHGIFPSAPLPPPPPHPAPQIVVPPPTGLHYPWPGHHHRRWGGAVFVYPGYPGYCPFGALDCGDSYYYDNSNCWMQRRVTDSHGNFAGWRRVYVCQGGQ
jgi:hypothetical protein